MPSTIPQERLQAGFDTDAAGYRHEIAALQQRIRELEQTVAIVTSGLDALRGDLERARSSTAWRLGHALTTGARHLLGRRVVTQGSLVRALERIDHLKRANVALPAPGASIPSRPLTPVHDSAAVARAEGPARKRLAEEIRARLGEPPAIDPWPTVSIVVVTRDGRSHLVRLLDGLTHHTDYPAFELVVVDNGSTDGTPALFEQAELPFTCRLLRNEDNQYYSEANNQGARAAGGDILVFLNNDVEPFEPGWLRELVHAATPPSVGIAGATLLHVVHDTARTPSGWVVQHRGIKFRSEERLPRAFNLDDGADLYGPRFGVDSDCPAVTAACLAVRADVFWRVGGFSTGYRYGTEDVDLGLQTLQAGLAVRCSGRTVLFHRESSTRAALAHEVLRQNLHVNRKLFHERWSARLRREVRVARLVGDRFWTDEQAHVGVTLSSVDMEDGHGDWFAAHELGDELERAGLRVTYLQRRHEDWYAPPDDLDCVVSLLDSFDAGRMSPSLPVIAWIRNWTERWLSRPWFERLDVLLASSIGSAEILESHGAWPSVRFPLATNPARFRPAPDIPRDVDYVFTGNHWGVDRDIQAALAPHAEERFELYGRGWSEVPTLAAHARGAARYETLPAIYARSKLVIDDTAGPTLPYGAVNSRVFDALAAGALVVTNCERGVRELFDDEFPVWSSEETLRAHIDKLLHDRQTRERLVRRYRTEVIAKHTYEERARELMRVLHDREHALSFCIKIGAPDWTRAERWGDLYFARALQRELKRRDHRSLIQVLPEWEDPHGLGCDVAIVLRGRSRHHPKPGQFNVLWSISHPDDLSPEECDGYDLVAVASRSFADRLRSRLRRPVIVLEQATDAFVFYPEFVDELVHDAVFVGNSRGVRRPALEYALPMKLDLAVWGSGWDGLLKPRDLAGEFAPNDELRRLYASAKVVLNDHWDDMREHGYISNRIYDVLASGGVVLSDAVPGLDERFDGAVATYRDADELRVVLERLLGDPDERRRRAEAGRAAVLREHTFAHRLDVLLSEIQAVREADGWRTGIREVQGDGAPAPPRLVA